ncbi:3'(2'),5'-bisphosphate nucleotidase CysQ [Methylovirgula sp. 4M-Z18]|uniref:3'(2'),5'-bisphosphate nucleotidase CysQ n=1 Tax=Methylovirgula sp. 4M-Z18 TaxID=2293567 RepID=UPI000E2E5785|nr:3'(2'),5'-bisphosphate nucleotidase CysQ [Methylovirgula sp. 4M-Z18]RFB78301.1 3'(2'),5'-bisphosphate nucleotidase [Methylovirgula sp. 4M-Z18]
MNPVRCNEIAEIFAALSVKAGAVIMEVYGRGCAFRMKSDASPVSEADELAEEVVLAGLAREIPGIPVIAEESVARGEVPPISGTFILVDPLDGTKEFMCKNGEFTVNIALISDGVPIAGAVYAPALGKLWFGGADAYQCAVAPGAALPPRSEWCALKTRPAPRDGLTAVVSRSHGDLATEAFLAKLPVNECRSAGSSLKFCLVAEGLADVYPRFAPTMEWDTAAGEAVLRAAGGKMLNCDKSAFLYGKTPEQYRNPSFIAWGDAAYAEKAAV